MRWYQISLLLCFFGFLKEIRPSEPFVSDYLQKPYRNITAEELNRYIYPIATYSNIILSVLVLLVTDLLRIVWYYNMVTITIISYAGYLLFYIFYSFTITVSSAEIAKELPEDSYGLIFGVNAFFAYCMQSMLTAVVASDSFGLSLNIFQQMNVYGGFIAVIGCVYFLLLTIFGIRSIGRTGSMKTDLSSIGANNNSQNSNITSQRDCINSL